MSPISVTSFPHYVQTPLGLGATQFSPLQITWWCTGGMNSSYEGVLGNCSCKRLWGGFKHRKKEFSPEESTAFFYIWQKEFGIHTAQTSKSSWTPLREEETCGHAAGFGLSTRGKSRSRIPRSRASFAAAALPGGTGPVSPLPATRALCRHSEHLCAFPAFIQPKNYFTGWFTYQTSSSCLSLPSSSGNGSIQ